MDGKSKDLVFFKGLATGHFPMSIWAAQIGVGWLFLFLFCFVLGEGTKVEGWTWEEWKVSLIGVHCTKFPNNS